ncbi:hypothetical protein C8Q80DRAFT_633976 [Daedaleopsis nitida]|nr:hypothetical protein C8Q80DRAFT_633976 [Daedaleopsis nitida]
MCTSFPAGSGSRKRAPTSDMSYVYRTRRGNSVPNTDHRYQSTPRATENVRHLAYGPLASHHAGSCPPTRAYGIRMHASAVLNAYTVSARGVGARQPRRCRKSMRAQTVDLQDPRSTCILPGQGTGTGVVVVAAQRAHSEANNALRRDGFILGAQRTAWWFPAAGWVELAGRCPVLRLQHGCPPTLCGRRHREAHTLGETRRQQ